MNTLNQTQDRTDIQYFLKQGDKQYIRRIYGGNLTSSG